MLFFLAANILILAQPNSHIDISYYANHPLKVYTNKDGLPQNAVISIAIDSIGKLWVGTQDGAAYYNGRIWEKIKIPGYLTSNYIQTIKVGQDGAIWFGVLRDGIYRYKDGKWNFWGLKEGLPSNYILCIYEQVNKNDGNIIWIGTNNGAARYINGKWETFSSEEIVGLSGNIVYDIYQGSDNKLWFATNNGLSYYSQNYWKIVPIPFTLRKKQIYRIMQSKDGVLWFGGDGTLLKYKNNSWELHKFKGSGTSNVVNAILESKDGIVWLGTHSGIYNIIEDSISKKDILKFVNIRNNTQKKDEFIVWSILETEAGNLWFGTFLGLFRYSYGKWLSIDKYMDLDRGGTNCIWERSGNEFWFGTENGLVIYRNGVWNLDKNISGSILSLFESTDRAMWVSVLFKGIYRYKDYKWIKFTKDNGLAENSNWFIYQTSDGAMWFGSDAGVTRFKDNKWSKITKADGLVDNTVLCMLEASDSSLWFGTTSGATVIKKGKKYNFTKLDGLGGNVISAIYENNDSIETARGIWIATMGGGVSKFNPVSGKWHNYNTFTTPKLSNNTVYRIEKDSKGRLYFLTSNMVTRFTFKNDNNIVADIFSTEDGLPNNEGISSASFVDSKGRIWVGTTEGAAFYDLNKEINYFKKNHY
ncbi:Putative periplasmic ligand-binding sensor domain protein [Ignavibacterium album JCM 16511]|uniref:Putative periplasmic ligand-binding sensor domain protein n=1 Tax=Ignavibacterium album (strain DSM 19864 / JCM 16511 / NBRC 101810 / Mat9-16) TaxID=945713 RepID=I0AHY3_IGNAJ|nr:two-component regulator propeller domain-containing protein [Ignavibacterium album]AFH48590.1 Putative periplasmic ligand-binding sensor domain protein [Ignavibacterium album JCM 16511]